MVDQSERRVRHPSPAACLAVAAAALAVTACSSLDTGSLTDKSAPPTAGLVPVADGKSGAVDLPPRIIELARANAAKPHDTKLALGYARALKKDGRLKEAFAVLETASVGANSREIQVERGLLALELGQTAQAREFLAGANDPKSKDWRVLSGLGIASSTLGQQGEAQKFFQTALELAPNNATIMNNLAMSYILDRKIDKAEQLLRRAAKSAAGKPRVAQNLALAVSLKAAGGESDAMARVQTSDATRTDGVAYGAPPMGLLKAQSSGIAGSSSAAK